MTMFGFETRAILRISILLMFSATLQMACSPPARILRESSSPLKPAWIAQPPQSGELLYFVGIKTGTDTLEEGREAAIKDAMAKIANFLGSKVQSAFEEHSTEIEQKLKQQITSRSTASVFGAQIVDWYHEKTVRIDKKFRMEKYDVYALVSFKKAEVEKESQRQHKEKVAKVTTAYELYIKGLELEKQKAYQDAHRLNKQALSILKELDDFVVVDIGNITNSEELSNLLKTKLHDVLSKMRRVTLSIKVDGQGKALQAFQSSLASALNEKGYTVTTEEPAIEIVGDISVKESGYVMNNFVYYSEGSVSAKRFSDGQIVTVVPLKVKGFHRTREQAANNSLSEAGIEAGKTLVNSLIEKENSLE